MYINQSLSEQTLALFKTAGASQDGTEAPKTSLASSYVADQALKFALSKIALAARAGEPAAPVFEGAGAGIPEALFCEVVLLFWSEADWDGMVAHIPGHNLAAR